MTLIPLAPVTMTTSSPIIAGQNLKRQLEDDVNNLEEEEEEVDIPVYKSRKVEVKDESALSRIMEAGFGIMFPAILSMGSAMLFKSLEAYRSSNSHATDQTTLKGNGEQMASNTSVWNNQSIFR